MDYKEYLHMDVVIREHHGRCRRGFAHGCGYPR
ncbi:MAG: hypothetical protein ACI90A_001037, partial [Shewanella sp.]